MTTFTGPSPETEPGIGALTFGGFLEEVAAKFAERPAVVAVPAGDARVEWSYAELRDRAWAMAKALLAAGVSRGTRVAILLANRPEWVAATWAAAMAGGVAVPFSTFVTREELGHLLRHSDTTVVLTETGLLGHRFVDDLLELCPEARTASPGKIRSRGYPFLRRVVTLDGTSGGAVQSWTEFLAAGAGVPDAVLAGVMRDTVPTEDAIIIYSSGTTSLPKGVLHRHRGPMLQCWRHADREGYTPEDRVYCGLPMFWTAGFAAVLGATLASGACLVLPPYFEPSDMLRVIEEEGVTVAQAIMAREPEVRAAQQREQRDLSSIRRDRWRWTDGVSPDGARPANQAAYGSSETFTSATALPEGSPPDERHTYGRLIAGASMRILDPATGVSLGAGEEGEIVLKGLTMMHGYVKLPPEDAFDEDGWFHSGDLGFVDDRGLLHFTGRLTTVIKTSGANVSPLEVEEALLRHPDIVQAAVVGVPDGEVGEVVVACVVAHPGSGLSEDRVREYLRAALSRYKIPRRVLFVDEGVLPRTGSEKVNVPALRALAGDLISSGTT
jgi:fatty-acyl-CoA synthase